MLINTLQFTPEYVKDFFGLVVTMLKFGHLLMMLEALHLVREQGIVDFEDDGEVSIFGFSSLRVRPGGHGMWNESMLKLAFRISTRAAKGECKVPTSCLYEIFQFCGIVVMNKGKHTTSAKKTVEAGEFFFDKKRFDKTKKRIIDKRQNKNKGCKSTPEVLLMLMSYIDTHIFSHQHVCTHTCT